MWRAAGALLLIATLTHAQALHNTYETCSELTDPLALPPLGKELLYCKAANGLCAKDSGGTVRCTGGGGGGGGTNYQTFMNQGSALPGRATANFTGAGVSCVDNAGALRTDCTIAAAASHALLDGVFNNDTLAGAPTQGALIMGNATPAWATLAAGAANTALTANGTTEAFTSINDATLANAYSGAGSCSPAVGFVQFLNRNAIPTCAQVNLAAGSTDITGVLSHTNGGTDVNTAPVNNALIGNGITWQRNLVPISQAPLHYQALPTGFIAETNVIWANDFVDCRGVADATTGWANLIAQIRQNATFGTSTVYLPSGCLIRFASPGANNTAGFVPPNTHIYCDDESAGFAVDQQTCLGGTYAGHACNSNADCVSATGNGTCQDSFGHTAVNPCTSTTCFAPTAGTIYTVLRDQGIGSHDIQIENCSIFVGQASPYQVCSGGTSNGLPCRQECDNGTTSPNFPGERCEVGTDCHASLSCLRTADCHAGGGTCGGLAPQVPSGPGKIRALDFPSTFRVLLRHVQVFDSFVGDYTVKTGPNALIQNTDIAREITNCTSPIPGTPSASSCFSNANISGTCCYGASYALAGISSGNKFNTQPTTNVAQGLVVGANSQVVQFSRARGTTAFLANGTAARFDETVVVPQNLVLGTTDERGPGTPSSTGWSIFDHGQVTKSFGLDICGSGTGISSGNADSGAVADKIFMNSGCGTNGNGVLGGTNNHIMGMNIKGVSGTGAAVLLSAGASNAVVSDSYFEGAGTASLVNVAGSSNIISSNVLVSNPVNTQSVGVAVSGANNEVNNNVFQSMKDCSVQDVISSLNNITVEGNTSVMATIGQPYSLSTLYATPTFHPTHFCEASVFNNNKIVNGNIFYLGAHGIARTRNNGTFGQMGINGNRFHQLGGQPMILFDAVGVNETANYINSTGKGWTTSCDASCPTNLAGIPCNQDSDCGACTTTTPCRLDAMFSDVTQGHFSAFGNLWFQGGGPPVGQCTVAGPIGQACDSTGAGGTCAGGATCAVSQTGGPFICQTGADIGKRCCQTGAGATCAPREQMVGLRFDNYGTGINAIDAMIIGNQMFNLSSNFIAFDAGTPPGDTQTGGIISSEITSNLFDPVNNAQTGIIGIRLPTVLGTTARLSIDNNNFKGLLTQAGATASANNIVNYQGSVGALALEDGQAISSEALGLGTGTAALFFPFTTNGTAPGTPESVAQQFSAIGPMTVWKMQCVLSAAPGTTSTRTITLRDNAVSTALTCTVASGATTCVTASGASSAPVAVNAGDLLDFQATTNGVAPAAASANCVAYASYDTAL